MENKNKLEQLFVTLIPYLLGLALMLLLYSMIQIADTKSKVNETAAYTRTTNCIVGKVADPPTTQDAIELCYAQVEKDTGVSLERFDKQRSTDN